MNTPNYLHPIHQPRSLSKYLKDPENGKGCYAILFKTANRRYVAYIGSSTDLTREVGSKLVIFRNKYACDGHRFLVAAVRIASPMTVVKTYESLLIRYYSPPWNVSFR